MRAEQSASASGEENISGHSTKHKPEQPWRSSPGLRKSVGDIHVVSHLAEDYDSANLASSSPPNNEGSLFKPSDVMRDPQDQQRDLFSTMDIRVAMNTASGPVINAIYPVDDHHGHTSLRDTIDRTMVHRDQLEAAIYKTSIAQDKDGSMRSGVTSMTHFDHLIDSNKTSEMLAFESTQKDIFESSGVVQIQPEISPERMMATDLAATQTTSVGGYPIAVPKGAKVETTKAKPSYFTLFVIFGLDSNTFVRENMKEEYNVLGSYPNLDKHKEIAKQHKFVQDLKLICFPEVELKVERFHLSQMDPVCRHSFFHFIATNNMGEKQYLTSVHFKEIMLCEQGAFVIPKAVCVASSQPIFSLQKQVLNQIFHKVVLQNNNVSIKAFKEAQRTYEGFLDEFDQPPGHDFPNFVFKFMMESIMCTNNRRMRDRSSPSRSPERRTVMRMNREVRQALPVVDFTPILELYITIFSKHLYFDQSVDRDIQITINDSSSNQSMFGKSPAGGGLSKVNNTKQQQQLEQGNIRNIPIFTVRNLKPFGFQLENYQFELLLQKVKPEKLIQLFTVMLLERKIVLIKDDIGDIALIMQSLIALLNPFQWCFSIITYLTRDLVDMLDAPFPFIIGVPTPTWEDICTLKDFPEEIYVFDLESQERRNLQRFEIPELPHPQGDFLLAGLKDIMEKKDHRLESLRNEERPNKSKQRKLDQRFDEYYWADAQLSVKQLFFNFLLETVGNYVQYYRTNEEQEERDQKASDKQKFINNMKSSEDFFDFDLYLESREKKFEGNFMSEFIKTQTFHEFIEQQYGDKYEKEEGAESASMFFDSCIDVLVEHDMSRLKAAQQEMIDTAMHNLQTPVKYKFTGILQKYVEGLQKTEKKFRKKLEEVETPEKGFKGLRFCDMNESDQIDEVIMKHIFMRYDNQPGFHQLSLINEVNENMIYEGIPRINYDQVETYWKKKYKAKVRPESSKPHNKKQPTSSSSKAGMKQKRLPTKNELEYDQYINGNQALEGNQVADNFSSIDVPLHSAKSRATVQHTTSYRSIDRSNVIHDEEPSESIGHSTIDVFNFRPGQDRQAHSTRNFNSNTVQKGLRTAYSKRITNSGIEAMAQKNITVHKQSSSMHDVTLQSQGGGKGNLNLPKSPRAVPLMKQGTNREIPRIPKGAPIYQSSKSVSGMTTRGKASARTKSHVNNSKVSGVQIKKLTLNIHGKKPENFNEKVKLAKQRGSVHNLTSALTGSATQELRLRKRQRTPSDWQNIEMSEAPPRGDVTAKAFDDDDEEDMSLRHKLSSTHSSHVETMKTSQSGIISTRSGLHKEILPLTKPVIRHHKHHKMVSSMRSLDLKQIKMEYAQKEGSFYAKGGTRQASQLDAGNSRIKSVSNLQANNKRLNLDSSRLKGVTKVGTWQPSQMQDIPVYTEKKATTQMTAAAIVDQKTTVNTVKISIEKNNIKDSFLNIVKSEEQSQEVVFMGKSPQEMQHGEQPTPPMMPQNVQLSPSVDPDNMTPSHPKFPNNRPPNSQIPEFNNPDYHGPSFALPAFQDHLEDMVHQNDQADEEDIGQYQTTEEGFRDENYRDLEAELGEDSHHFGLSDMTQKSNYLLEYRSKFSVGNTDAPHGAAGRQQMMPQQFLSKRNEFAAAPNKQQQVSATPISNKVTMEEPDSALLVHQASGVSIDSRQSPQLHAAGVIGSSEKNPQRKGQAIPLSMLLQKTNSQPKRQSSSKTRSITEKQRSLQNFTFLPQPKSQVSLPGYDGSGMAQLQKTQSFPIADDEKKQLNEEEENEDEGWFTAKDSRRISQLDSQPVKATEENQKKLTQLYRDLDGSFLQNSVVPFDKKPKSLQPSPVAQEEQFNHQFRQQAVNYPPQIAAQQDSPQQSSRMSTDQLIMNTMRTQEGQYPTMRSNIALGQAKTGANEEEKKVADNSITAPMDGILFSHQKRRNEKYRNQF